MLLSGTLPNIDVKPDYHYLAIKIARMTGRSAREVMNDNPGLRERIKRDNLYGGVDAMLIGVWAKRVVDGHITIEDIFQNTHEFESPDIPFSKQTFFFYHLLGIAVDQWLDWRNINVVGSLPHYIRRVLDIGKDHGYDLQPLDIQQLYSRVIVTSTQGQRNRVKGKVRAPSIDVVTAYVKFLSAIQRIGFDPRTIQSPSEWWAADWSPEAVVRFCNLGVTLDQVKELEASGITTSETMIRILFDGFPLEWAIAAAKAREF